MKYDDSEHQKLRATRLAAGKLIDPATAEITRRYACMFDPCGDGLDVPEELQQVGREEFVRAPGAQEWIHIRDLPESSRDVILRRLGRGRGCEPDPVREVDQKADLNKLIVHLGDKVTRHKSTSRPTKSDYRCSGLTAASVAGDRLALGQMLLIDVARQ